MQKTQKWQHRTLCHHCEYRKEDVPILTHPHFPQKMRKYLQYFPTLCIFADKILFNLQSIHSKPRFMGNQMFHKCVRGELMADISTSPDAQQFKYGGKVPAANRTIDNRSARRRALAREDRSFGLDLYDFHAHQQDAKLGRFNSIDPLAENYYWLSPYAYCGGDPVNCVDPDGKEIKWSFSVQKQKGTIDYYLNTIPELAPSLRAVAEDKNYTVTILLGNGNTYYDSEKNTITWDPYMAIETTSGYRMSPMECLFHEFAHALHRNTDKQKFDKDKKQDSKNPYDNAEDESVIKGEEQTNAKLLEPVLNTKVPEGGTRQDHAGTKYQSTGSNSTTPTTKGEKQLKHERKLNNVECTK
ncbi:MAG: hypothetical protein K6E73_12400 [Bacteroidales bacterium]|nr:hypothetical protein [Bacteroidales bacterium]